MNSVDDDRGRHADSPTEVPAKGWKDIAVRVKDEIGDDNTSLASAGVSFFGFLSLVPGLAAVISIYAMFADPMEIQRQLSEWLGNLPEEARALITGQISRLSEQTTGALTWGTVVAVGLALWMASSGMSNLIKAINMAYDEEDQRNFLVRRGLALLLSMGAILLLVAIVFAITAVFPWLSELTGSAMAAGVGQVVAWILAGAAFAFALAVLYRVGPHRDKPEWKWVSWGSIVAVILWLVATVLFRIYVANFATYDETYGSLAAVVILLFWLYITSFVVLLGAQINAEAEHQTRADTTVGRHEPMGQRDAEMADTLGSTRAEDPDR
ncbi:MAG: YihY/virulence factor BrkB family protein [Actinomycetota bacterium]